MQNDLQKERQKNEVNVNSSDKTNFLSTRNVTEAHQTEDPNDHCECELK